MDAPLRPVYSPWSSIGTAFNQGAGIVSGLSKDLQDEKNKKNILQQMVEKRAQAALEAKYLADEQKRKEWGFDKKKEAAKNEMDYNKFASGISPTYADNLDLSQGFSAPNQTNSPYGSHAQDIADLSNINGNILPDQNVQSYDPSWGMGLDAVNKLDAQNNSMKSVRPSDDELLTKALSLGQMDTYKKIYESKPKTKESDEFNNPILLADWTKKIQTPEFEKIAKDYAQDPVKNTYALQKFIAENGYSGQKWLSDEFSHMFKNTPFAMTSQGNQDRAFDFNRKKRMQEIKQDIYKDLRVSGVATQGPLLNNIHRIVNFDNENPEIPNVGNIYKNVRQYTRWLDTDKGLEFSGNLTRLFNTELRDISGSAVTDNELDRMMATYGLDGIIKSPDLLTKALRIKRDLLKQAGTSVKSQYVNDYGDEDANTAWGAYSNQGFTGDNLESNLEPKTLSSQDKKDILSRKKTIMNNGGVIQSSSGHVKLTFGRKK